MKCFIHSLIQCVVNVSGQQTRMLFKNGKGSFSSLGIQKDLYRCLFVEACVPWNAVTEAFFRQADVHKLQAKFF